MPSLRLIAVALLAASAAAPLGLDARAEPLDREMCKSLQVEKNSLLTNEIRAALERGPDWVKEHLHSAEDIEKVRQFLLIEEKVAFQCRTDGVVIPKPEPVPLPDRKPALPPVQTADADSTTKVLAGAASTSLLPLRKPSLSSPDEADAADATDAGAEAEAGDAADDDADEEVAETASQETASSTEPEPGPSQR